MNEERTQFDYLLNALERAAQADKPAEHDYGQKRKALFAYVRDLEAKARQVEQTSGDSTVNAEGTLVSSWPDEQSPSSPSSPSPFILLGAEGKQ